MSAPEEPSLEERADQAWAAYIKHASNCRDCRDRRSDVVCIEAVGLTTTVRKARDAIGWGVAP